MAWETIDEEYPPNTCRRCDRAYYCDDGDEKRSNIRSSSSVVHIERIDGGWAARIGKAQRIIWSGGRATYCGLRVAAGDQS